MTFQSPRIVRPTTSSPGCHPPPAGTSGSNAVILHEGPFDDLDKAYGALGTFVAERAIGADGPIREHYLVSVADDPADLRTEVAWPVNATIPVSEGRR